LLFSSKNRIKKLVFKALLPDFGLEYMLGLRQGNQGRKKRMDRNWWNDIQTMPSFDPEAQESDWRLLFGANNQNEFHPDLSWADSQWSDHATGVGILIHLISCGKLLSSFTVLSTHLPNIQNVV
jgi:hypothetical protein